MNRPCDHIAVFDSGVGGISVLRQLLRLMPGERYIYYGDSANAPYGSRPEAQVRQLTLAAVETLMDRGVKALVVACNTATAAAIDQLRQQYPDMVIIGIEPAIKVAADRYPGGTIGVLATPVTLEGDKFSRLSRRLEGRFRLIPLPAPGLARLVEEGKANSAESEALLRQLLDPWAGQLDALVLGCTHYPFAAATLRKILGNGTELIDGGEGTARETRRRLAEKGLLWEGGGSICIENSMFGPQMPALCKKLMEEEV